MPTTRSTTTATNRKLAIFDLDNTLIAGDSDHSWGEFLFAEGLVDAETHRKTNDAFYIDYQQGKLDVNAYLHFVLGTFADKTPSDIVPLQNRFVDTVIQPMMLPKAQQLLQQHRDNGDELLIITATNELITAPIARLLGVDNLLASQAELANGKYTGAPTGVPCYREGKVTRLQQWLTENAFELESACFYSDSHNDIPLLEYVGTAIVVDGDSKLLAHAEKKGWSCISLR